MARRKRQVQPAREPVPVDVGPEDLIDPRIWLWAAQTGDDIALRAMTPTERLAWAREHAPKSVLTPEQVRAEREIARRNLDWLKGKTR